MTANQFRRLALSFAGTEEKAHQAHPDFRLRNRIFATLGYPDEEHGMVKLKPEEQAKTIAAMPRAFRPAAGTWGRNGSTLVLLSQITAKELKPIMRDACAGIR